VVTVARAPVTTADVVVEMIAFASAFGVPAQRVTALADVPRLWRLRREHPDRHW
jgi:hypothetical protein